MRAGRSPSVKGRRVWFRREWALKANFVHARGIGDAPSGRVTAIWGKLGSEASDQG